MTERQLKKLKRREEQRILQENEGMYAEITSSFYKKDAKKAPEKRSVPRWVPIFAASLAAFVLVVGVGVFGMAKLSQGIGNALEGFFDQKGGGDAMSPSSDGVLSILTVENALQKTSLTAGGLKFKEDTLKEEDGVYAVSVDTFHTFDMLIQVEPEKPLLDGFELAGARTATANGFSVRYVEARKRMEDFYEFSTKAVVETGSETICIIYDYSSQKPECELLEMIEKYIKPKK